MTAEVDIRKIQKRVYMSLFQDGLWDILLGFFLLGWGLMITYDLVAIMGGVWVALYFIVMGLKRWLVYPRAGYIKIAAARRLQVRMVILGLAVFGLGLGAFFLVSTGHRPAWFSEYFMFIFGVMVVIIVAFLAYWWQAGRWYLWAAMILVSFAIHQWADTPLNLAFMVPGGIITVVGIWWLYRFLRKYPKTDLESPHEA